MPTEIADSLDFSEGDTGRELPKDGEGVSNPLEEAAESVLEVERLKDLAVPLDFEENEDGGGDLGRRNCLGCFRNVNPDPGARPRRWEGLGESDDSATVASEFLDIPENDRGADR